MVCYVVLHYMVLEETIGCINSIKEIFGIKRIIVIDNCSTNGSGDILKKIFINDNEVHLIINESNLGFAKANNIGYEYALKNFGPDYIVIMNNDTLITNKNFEIMLEEAFHQTNFSVLGPKIFSTSLQVYQNPKMLSPVTYDYIEKVNKEAYFKLTHTSYTYLRILTKKIPYFRKIKHLMEKREIDIERMQIDVVLHGSFLVFSTIFFENFESPFYSDTFFYFETEILDYRLRKKGLLSVYYPDIKVLHNQQVSTKEVFKTEVDRVNFMNENMYNSTKSFLNYLNK